MDFFQLAFGGFSPQDDPDAAVKLCLQALAADHRLPRLTDLLTEGSDIGGIEGEPGWLLERRDDGDMAPGYAAWPRGAKFRAFVDPSTYDLAASERFYAWAEFSQFVRAIVVAYVARHPDRADALKSILLLLREAAA